MINPIEIVGDSPGLVLRVGGNVLLPRGVSHIDEELVSALEAFIQHLARQGRQTTLVVGGVGGQVYLDWARNSGCSDAFLNEIGCKIIDLAAGILADTLHRRLAKTGIPCSPVAATSIQQISSALSVNQVVVAGAEGIRGAISSDSLALLIAGHLSCPTLSIKRQLPFREKLLERADLQDANAEVRLVDIRKEIHDSSELPSAGWHGSLDSWALDLLRKPETDLYITTASAMHGFPASGLLSVVMKVTGA